MRKKGKVLCLLPERKRKSRQYFPKGTDREIEFVAAEMKKREKKGGAR